MAEQCRTVRVGGLPTDIEDDRLTDKLCIHFLRSKNGGGEIASVTIVEAAPGGTSALITFEDSRVAQRVIQRGQHIFQVDRKKYELTITEHHDSLDPDKVIVSMSVSVDYSQLPQRRTTVTSLHKSHPDVQISFNTHEELCTLRGAYSQVQAALAQLLGLARGPKSVKNMETLHPSASVSVGLPTVQSPYSQESGDCNRRLNERGEHREQVHTGDVNPSSQGHVISEGHSFDDIGLAEGGAVAQDPTSEDDFSLIMDADLFQYLQKHCKEKYQHILRMYGVEVVDVTTQGLTTLFLQSSPGVDDAGHELERLRLASGELSRLYQENETKIRRAQLPKSILYPRGGLQRVIDNLGVRLPKLLLSEDERNIYIVGSSSDVSEAKQFLLLDQGKDMGVAGLLRSPSSELGSSKGADEETFMPAVSPVGSLDRSLDKMLKAEGDEGRAEGTRRYKLAARFKDSGLGGLGNRPGDLTTRVSSSSRHTGPVLGHGSLSEIPGFANRGFSSTGAQNTGGDILFKTGDASLSSTLTNTSQKFTTGSLSTSESTWSGSTIGSTAGSGSNLRRSSSFSGTTRPKAQAIEQRDIQEDSGKATSRARNRSSSFSSQTSRDKKERYTAEITVPRLMWCYIKEAYGIRLEDLTSDLQMKESHSEPSGPLTVILTGADSLKVSSCQLGLQRLVAMVTADFCVQELCLSELGVADPADETLGVCCEEVRSRFKKVSVRIMKETIYLMGPKHLCSQVGAALREVFSGESYQTGRQKDFSNPTSTFNQSFRPQLISNQNTALYNNTHQQLDRQKGGDNMTGGNQERDDSTERQRNGELEHTNGSVSQQLIRKDPVIKVNVMRADAVHLDGGKSNPFNSHSEKGNNRNVRPVNGVGSMVAHAREDAPKPPKESNKHCKVKNNREHGDPEGQENPGGSLIRSSSGRSSLRGMGGICVCGESGASVKRTDCGVTLCPKCLVRVHVHCRVCPKTESLPQGIQGSVSYSEMPVSLQGHTRDSTLKITYSIPDGIQGEGHPFPGCPFKGGVFEAYLPLCDRTRKLLPRLERAFRLGLTFTVTGKETGARVTWDCIPHKTSLQGGKSGNGYPDSNYLTWLSEVLASHGIEETPAKSQDLKK